MNINGWRDPAGRWAVWAAAAILTFAALATYAPTLGVPFLLDDRAAITENSSILDLHRVGKILAPDASSTADRPLLNLTFAVNYAWSGFRVWSYHALNLAIHILAGLTLFGITRRTLQNAARAHRGPLGGEGGPDTACRTGPSPTLFAFAVALLWIVHPLLTEAVTYISQRAESLMGLFYLLTLYCFIRGAESEQGGRRPPGGGVVGLARSQTERRPEVGGHLPPVWFALSVAACLLGTATKEVMVTAPLLVLLYDRALLGNSFRAAVTKRRGYYLGLVSSWLFLGFLMRGSGLAREGAGFQGGMSWLSYALTELKAVTEYVKLSFWPHPLVFDYGSEMRVTRIAPAAPFALFVIALAVAAVIAWRRSPALGFLAVSFFVLLAPTSSIVPIAGQPMAESRMYLPLAALAAVVGLAFHAAAGRKALAGLVCLAVVLAALTVRRNHDYRSAAGLWEKTVAAVPGSSRAQYNLANALAKIPGRLPEALVHYEAALRIRPDYADAHYNLANGLATVPGRLPDAIAHYEAALRIRPDYAEADNNLANALATLPGRLPDALAYYEEAVRIKPDYVQAQYSLARGLANLPGRLPDAIAHYEAALRIEPDNAQAHNNVAVAYARLGRVDEAIQHLERALQLDPALNGARRNLEILRAARQ